MPTDCRHRLLAILARLDQVAGDVAEIRTAPVFADIDALAEELVELVADLRAKVEEKLDSAGD